MIVLSLPWPPSSSYCGDPSPDIASIPWWFLSTLGLTTTLRAAIVVLFGDELLAFIAEFGAAMRTGELVVGQFSAS